ncbi:MAG: dehydrogenase E1 component subunit alpha/beta [Bacteroidota bacterium]
MRHATHTEKEKHAGNPASPPRETGALAALPRERILEAYRNSVAARLIDEKILILVKQGKCFFHIGGSGHEIAQTASALALRPGRDWAYPYYRDLAFSLQFGYTVEEVMLEALHRKGGPASDGFAMPFHYGRKPSRIVSQSSPTGTQYLQAVGTAMGAVKAGLDEVVYVSSGEGSTSEGEFHEALNWAVRGRYPVIFLIQNNRYAISVPVTDQVAGSSVHEMVAGYRGLGRARVDGCDAGAVYEAMGEAVRRARAGEGPSVIEADVVRLLPHSSSDDHRKYRSEADLEQDRRNDPLPRFEAFLAAHGILDTSGAEAVRKELKERIDRAAEAAEAAPIPRAGELELHVYAPAPSSPQQAVDPPPEGPRVVLVDAVNHALAEEMERNPGMLVYGEDVAGNKGGVFTATRGLTARFGEKRVFNSPLAEASIVGTAFGLAVRGDFRPVVEIQFGDYIWPAFMQIRDEVAMLRFRSAGTWTCPMVIRVAVGGYIHGGLYHSQSIEAFFTHIPGLRVVFPSTAADAKGLLKTACRADDPVLFLEHKGLYRQAFAASPEPPADYLIPFGCARTRREGSDLTVVSWGMPVQRCLDAAGHLAGSHGVQAEVLDLRTLNPLDTDAVLASVRKTGKVLIVHEDTLTGGFGAEIAALVAEEAFEHLDAPVRRVAARDTPVPYGPELEGAMLPQETGILRAMEELTRY